MEDGSGEEKPWETTRAIHSRLRRSRIPSRASPAKSAAPPPLLARSRIPLNSTPHQSSHGFATRAHGFPTKTKALAREIPPATQAINLEKMSASRSCRRKDTSKKITAIKAIQMLHNIPYEMAKSSETRRPTGFPYIKRLVLMSSSTNLTFILIMAPLCKPFDKNALY